MKLFYFSSILLIISTISFRVYSQCDWQDLGPSDINTVDNEITNYPDLALDNNNYSYQVFSDGDVGSRITVRRYNDTSWVILGTSGFSTGIASYNSIDIDNNNVPYVVYCDQGNGNKAIVKKFDGTDWIQVGNDLSTSSAAYTSLVIDENNVPYVAFRDASNGNKVTVVKFDGMNWITVGTAGFSTGTADYVSLAIGNTGIPYVVYQDGGNSNKGTVKKFNGTNWESVGIEGFTSGSAPYTKIAINSIGEPFVIYSDAANSNKITVAKYDGVNWLTQGNPSTEGYYSSITFDNNDLLYRIYIDAYTAETRVATFNSTNNNWYTVGPLDVAYGWEHVQIRIASNGVPHISIRGSNSLFIWKYTNSRWEVLGIPGFSAGTTKVTNSLAVSKTGIPYVAYCDNTVDGNIVVKRFIGNGWEQAGNIVASLSSGNGNESFSLALDTNDVPYIIYRNNGGYIGIKKFNGTSWTGIPSPTVGAQPAVGYYCDIAFDRKNNIPYISFSSENASYSSYNKVDVRWFDEPTQTWKIGSLSGNPSIGTIRFLSIAVDTNSIPYVAFADISTGNKVAVRRLIQNTSPWATWSNVGPNYSISTGNATSVNLTISSNNIPYVVYEDVSLGNKIVVKKFNGSTWELVGQEGFSSGKAYNMTIAIDNGGTPYVSFGDEANGNKVTVMKFNGTNWITVGTTGFSGQQVVDLGRRPATCIAISENGNIFTSYWNSGYIAAKKFNSSISTHYQTACSSELPISWNGESYTNSGTYQHSFTNAAGCDSTVTLHLTVNPSATGTDIQTACGSFTWIDNNNYTQSNNTATHTIIGGAANGCDSIVTLNLTINQPTTGTDVQTACGSYTWIDNNNYTQSNNTATHTITGGAVNGCDSIVTLNLTITPIATGTDIQTACGSYTWIDNNNYTQSTTTVTHTITGGAANGCDSIVTLNLTILPVAGSVDAHTACGSYTWMDNNTYTQSNNTATHTITGGATNGCDSIITLNLTILPISTSTDVQVSCGNPLLWIDGNTYTSNNNTATHTITGGAANGCDSTVTLNLTIIEMNPSVIDNGNYLSPSYTTGSSYQWIDCSNENVLFPGQNFYPSTGGDYKVRITKNGCTETSECYTFNKANLENINDDDFIIYPNPTNGILNIEGVKVEQMRVLDLNGQEMLLTSNANSIDVSILSPGCYFIEINNSIVKMFSKQ